MLKNRIEICYWLDRYWVKRYTINSDLTVDVDGDVWLENHQLTSIPVQFGKVVGMFRCDYNQLTSLRGCPTFVGDGFCCDHNKLTSLEGCPKTVGGSFFCDHNKLTSLEGCPTSVGKIFCCDTKLHKDPRYLRHLLKQKVMG